VQNWKKSVLALCVIAWLMPSTAPAQGLTEAQTDSLVSYIELLEYDLLVAEFRTDAKTDSLRVQMDILGRRLAIAEEARAKWYHDPRLWFTAGVFVGVVVTGAALNLSF
jgi:hypothetical protein